MTSVFVQIEKRRSRSANEETDSVRDGISAHGETGFDLGTDHPLRSRWQGTIHVVIGHFSTEFFANTDPPRPVPPILTEDETIALLRLTEGRNEERARRALRRLVETKRVRPARIGLRNRYFREELLRFARHATELSGDAPKAGDLTHDS